MNPTMRTQSKNVQPVPSEVKQFIGAKQGIHVTGAKRGKTYTRYMFPRRRSTGRLRRENRKQGARGQVIKDFNSKVKVLSYQNGEPIEIRREHYYGMLCNIHE